jgi:cellulose biosynthesis protein BcsQ
MAACRRACQFAALAARGHRVLLVDAHPQANATRNLGLPKHLRLWGARTWNG